MSGTVAVKKEHDLQTMLVVDSRRRGMSYPEIQRAHGINAFAAKELMARYWESESAIDPHEYRMLQLMRMESMIGRLMDQLDLGNVKAGDTLNNTLENMNKLLGLNLEVERKEIRIVTEQQTEVVVALMHKVIRALLQMIQEIVTDQTQLGQIEDRWDELVATTYVEGVQEIIVMSEIED